MFGVKALAAYTGVNPHTLRMWERRYGAVRPVRSPNGRRAYSQEDAERLCLIAELTSRGHAISSVATLKLSELERRVEESTKRSPSSPDASNSRVSGLLLQRMVTALESFHLRELGAQLATSRVTLTVPDFVHQIVLPLISRIGSMITDDKLSIAHEHALSAILKTQIYVLLFELGAHRGAAQGATDSGPSLAIATQEGDHHELGILMAALLTESRGIRTHFFGCNMPARALAEAANALKSAVVLIGRSIRMPVLDANGNVVTQKTYLKELDMFLLPDTQIWVGGVLEENALKFRSRHKVTHFPSLHEFTAHLAKWPK